MSRILAIYGFLICLLAYLPLQAQQSGKETETAEYSYPKISNYYIVYHSELNGNNEIIIYDWEKQVPWQLTKNKFEDRNPLIKNDLLVWEGITNGSESDIYMYDMEEEELVRFSTPGMNEYAPKIGGRKVAWMSESQEKKSIILYDRITKKAITIPLNHNGSDNFDLNDNYLVYRDFDGNDMEIYLYDIRTNIIKQITVNDYDDVEPMINGHFITWTGVKPANAQVYLHEINLNRTKSITTASSNNLRPQINDRYIVWEQQTQKGSNIAVYDLISGEQFDIEKDELDHVKPQLAGEYLMWYGIGKNNAKLYVHDMRTGAINDFSVNDYKNTKPYINGNMIVWRALDTEEKEIYLFSLK